MDEINFQKQAKTSVNGEHIISKCKVETERAQRIQAFLQRCHQKRQWIKELESRCVLEGERLIQELHKQWEEYNYWLQQLHKHFLVDQQYVHNVTTTVGRAVLANRLGGGSTNTGQVNYGALGDDNTAEVVGDTTLQNEVFRKLLSSGTNVDNVAYIENFYTATETTGTYEEYGFFIDGGAGADSGVLFNRFTQSITKSATETLNVQSIVTFADA